MANWLESGTLWDLTGGQGQAQPQQYDTLDTGQAWYTLPPVGSNIPRAYGKRLGSYRLQQQARQRMLQEQAALQLGVAPQQTGDLTAESAKNAESIKVKGAEVLPTVPKAAEVAPNWLTGAAGQGTWLRELIRPDRSIWERGGTLIEGAGKALGGLAEGTKGVIGSVTGALPSVGGAVGEGVSQLNRSMELGDIITNLNPGTAISNNVKRLINNREMMQAVKQAGEQEGLINIRPSATQVARQTAAEWLADGQDYSQKYRQAAGVLDKPFSGADDPATWAEYATRKMAYTSLATNDARQRAIQRVLAGENPDIVQRGAYKPASDAYTDEVAAWETQAGEYIEAQGRIVRKAALKQGASQQQADALAQQASEEAGRWINASNMVPGEDMPVLDMLGQMILDPLNLPGAGKLASMVTKPVVGKAMGVDKAKRLAQTVVIPGSADAIEAETQILTGLGKRERQMVEGLGAPGKVWKGVREYTARTKAKKIANITFAQIGHVINEAPTAGDALQAIALFWKDPDKLMATFGASVRNIFSQIARQSLSDDVMTKLGKLPSVNAERFDPLVFMSEAYDAIYDQARAITGAVEPGKMTGARKWAQTAKEWMSEFYLRTPGYIVRNWAADSVIGTMDGLEMFDDMTRVKARLEKYGVLTSRVQLADKVTSGAVEMLGHESKLAKVPVIGKWQNWIGKVATKAEEARYLRAYDSALKQFRAVNWAPKLSAQARQAMEQAGLGGMADALEAALRQAGSAKDARRAVNDVMNSSHGAAQVFVTKYGINPLDISPDAAAMIESKVREVAARGGDLNEVNLTIDRIINQTKARSQSVLADMGTAIQQPRATTAADVTADVAEEMNGMRAEMARAVNHGDVTREQADALLAQHEQALTQQATMRAQAVNDLRGALGAVTPEQADTALTAALHPVDAEYLLRAETRQQVDALWIAEKRKPPAQRNWQAYFEERRRLWGEANNQTVQAYTDATAALRELTAEGAENAEQILAKYKIRGLDKKAEELLEETRARVFARDVYAPEYTGVELAKRAEVEAELAQFSETLKGDRVKWDAARIDARRYYIQMVRQNPELAMEGTDIWISTQRAVDVRFTQAAARQEQWITQLLADEIDLNEYRALTNEEWGKAFTFATRQNGENAIARLRSLENRMSVIAGGLRDLGYRGDELKRMVTGYTDGTTADEVREILVQKRYAPAKPTPQGPMPEPGVSNYMEQALQPPASADDLLTKHSGDLQGALAEAEDMRRTVGGVADFGMQEARAAGAGTRIPSRTEINKYLGYYAANGELKPGRYEDALTELAAQYGFAPDDDIAGGTFESIRKWLERAKQTGSEAKGWNNASRKAAEDAYEKWDGIAGEIRDRIRHGEGMNAQDAAARDFVRQTVDSEGLAQASSTIRDITAGGTAQDAMMLEELAQIAREKAISVLDDADDLQKAYMSVEQTLADALFGTRNVDELAGVTVIGSDVQAEVRALEQFRQQRGIMQVAGLERERSVSTIRALAQELKLNPDDFVRGERGMDDVVNAAMQANPELARAALDAPTIANGKITAKAWEADGVLWNGERRTPGELLKELAPERNLNAESAKIAEGTGLNAESAETAESIKVLEPGEMTAEELARADEAVEQAGGNFEPLGTEQLIAAAERKQIAALEQIRQGIAGDWEKVVDPRGIPKAARQAVNEDAQRIIREWYEFKNTATHTATARADFSMLDYSDKRGGDTYAAMIAPYYYWGSRQARNFAIRLMQRPQILAQYQRYKDGMEREQKRRGLRGRFSGGIEVPGMPGVFVDPTALIFPFAELVRAETEDDNRSALASMYTAASQIGMRPAPWVDIPIRMSNILTNGTPGTPEFEQSQFAYGKGSVGSMLPQAQMIKGATALAGIGPAGGIDIERPVRRAMGLPESQPFEPYLVGRSVRDLSAERGVQPGQEVPYLLAQALISSAGDPTSGMSWGKLIGGEVTPEQIASQYSTTPDMAQAALQIVLDATDRAAKQKGVSTLASTLGGMRVQVLPEGEQRYMDMQAQERAAAYNPATGMGSRVEVERVRAENPTLSVGRAQYATLPGETTDAKGIYQNSQREAINAAFDALKDALIASKPWDRDTTRIIEDQRRAALDTTSTSANAQGWQAMYAQALAAIKGTRVETDSAYRPRSLVGANPQEAVRIREDELMRYVSATRPTLAQFSTGDYPDYNAYKAAVAKWEENLTNIAAASPQARAVVAQAQAEGNGAALQSKLSGVSVADVVEYWRRNDTPLEAAQRVWYEQVYNPAMEVARKGNTTNLALLPDRGATSAAELAQMVAGMYGDRWTAEELQQALQGVTMPALVDVVLENMTPAQREKAEQGQAFADYVRQKYGARGVKAFNEYNAADGATAKAAVRKRYSILKRVLADRAEFGK